ncbi:MAG: hypothetical protein KJ726_00715 [Verrucomicrobia bacterium]|nr:hypothetical protein [Verrucomicrobiota bacterium]
MPKLIESGFIYIAQPPLYRIKRKKHEQYIENDAELTRILLQLGIADVRVETTRGKPLFSGEALGAVLENLTEIERIAERVIRKGVDFEEYMKQRDAATGQFPQYRVTIGVGGETEHHYAQTESNLRQLREESEKRLGRQLEIFGEAGEEGNGRHPGLRWIEIYSAPALAKHMAFLESKKLPLDRLTAGGEPLFHLVEGENPPIPILTLMELLGRVRDIGRKGLDIQRYKGLGEMNPEQLWETTMNPEHRKLLKVMLEDSYRADQIFTVLMGSEVEPRRKFIEDNALNVRNLDI